MALDYSAIKKAAEGYKADMVRFLRAMISHPSESCEEKEVVACIRAEMEKLGFDKVEVDGLGNVIGWMGEGEKIIAIDSHIDTVGIGNRANWTADPYEGYETDEIIYGRGGSDQEGGMASAVYGARIMKDLGLIPDGYRLMIDGIGLENLIDENTDRYYPTLLHNDDMSPLFEATIEATAEALWNSLFMATDMKGRNGLVIPALPIPSVLEAMQQPMLP